MTWTDRRWIGIVFVRQILIAWLFVADQERYDRGVSFIIALEVVPVVAWAAIFAAASVPALVAVCTGRMRWARAAILISLVLSVYWTLALVAVQTEARTASWLLAVVWGALMLKDANLAFSGLGVRRQRPGV